MGSLVPTDFAKSHEAADKINGFVKTATKDMISELVTARNLNPLTAMVLVNALYFKGMWKNTFNKELTREGTFYTEADGEVKVDFMHMEASIKMGRINGFEVVALPYAGDRYTMYLMADHQGGHSRRAVMLRLFEKRLEDSITGEKILANSLNLKKLKMQTIKLEMPKFKIEQQIPLKDILMQYGVTDLFSDGLADLSGFTGGRDLHATDAIHKAVLEVNEEGSEGAAATAVILGIRSLRKIPTVRFDSPFLFFIKDEESGIIIFQGKVANPSKQ